jgi:hypothetical protein
MFERRLYVKARLVDESLDGAALGIKCLYHANTGNRFLQHGGVIGHGILHPRGVPAQIFRGELDEDKTQNTRTKSDEREIRRQRNEDEQIQNNFHRLADECHKCRRDTSVDDAYVVGDERDKAAGFVARKVIHRERYHFGE